MPMSNTQGGVHAADSSLGLIPGSSVKGSVSAKQAVFYAISLHGQKKLILIQ
jgi:hypothetical protein